MGSQAACGERPGLDLSAPQSTLGSVGCSPFQLPALQVLALPSWNALPHPQDSYSPFEAQFKHSLFLLEAWLHSAMQDG